MNFIPFDIRCYNRLHEKFQFLFEEKLINDICKEGKLRTFGIDEIVIDIGEPVTHMPLVIDGSIKVMTEDEKGDELLLYFLELGDTCAVTLNCCTTKAKSNVRAITETPADILFVPVEYMEEWMVKYKSWRAYVLDSFNIRLNEFVSAIDNIVFNSLDKRLVKYLKDKAWIAKSTIISISHADIASDLHSSRVVISRLMKRLENQGLIKQARNQVEVLQLSDTYQ